MISRRIFLASAGALILLRQASAQAAKVWRIGWLAPEIPNAALYLQAFTKELQAFGYIEGQNIVIEHRSSAGRTETLRTLAEELVQLKVDVIVAPTTPVARAAKAATSSIPIVFTIVSDPIGSGLVASFPRPGGNVTGMSDMGVDLVAKQLNLLKEVVPRLKRVGVVGHPADKVWDGVWREAPPAARQLRIGIVPVLIRTPNDFEAPPSRDLTPASRRSSSRLRLSFPRIGENSSNWNRRRDCRLSMSFGGIPKKGP